MLFKKNKQYQMDMDAANAALQNIFAACDKAPNTIPFDKIILRQNANTKPYNVLIIITSILLLLTFLGPLTVVPIATYMERFWAPDPVALINDFLEEDLLHLEFTGDHILYEECYMETLDGVRIEAASFDSKQGTICFPYDSTHEVNIYIPIKGGSELHFLLTPQE